MEKSPHRDWRRPEPYSANARPAGARARFADEADEADETDEADEAAAPRVHVVGENARGATPASR